MKSKGYKIFCTPANVVDNPFKALGFIIYSPGTFSPTSTSSSYGLRDRSITPNSSFHDGSVVEEPLKLGIEPKNLLDVSTIQLCP